MTLEDKIAIEAMREILARYIGANGCTPPAEDLATEAYAIARAMCKERSK